MNGDESFWNGPDGTLHSWHLIRCILLNTVLLTLLLTIPPSLNFPMNRLKQLVAIILNPTDYSEESHVTLEAAGVPVSFADCRNCPNPCEDGKLKKFSHSLCILNKNVHVGHEEYPHRVASTIDMTSEMLGSVRPYRRQVRVRQYVVYFWPI